MGFFDSIQENSEQFNTLHPKQALALAGITVLCIDDDVDGSEVGALFSHPSISRKVVDRAFDLRKQYLVSAKGSEDPLGTVQSQCIESVTKALKTDEQRLACLAFVLDIVMADGFIAESEKKIFEELIGAFEVDHEPVKEIFEIIRIKNNPNTFM